MKILRLATAFVILLLTAAKRGTGLYCYQCIEEDLNWKCNENEPEFCSGDQVCVTEKSETTRKGCGRCTLSRGDASEYSVPCKQCDQDLCNEPSYENSPQKGTTETPRHAAESFSGTKYILYAKKVTFWEARLLCANDGGILATIHDEKVQSYINKNFITDQHASAITDEKPPNEVLDAGAVVDPVGAWVGLYRNKSMHWMWTDNGSIISNITDSCDNRLRSTFQNWDTKEPKGFGHACGFVSREHNGAWKSGNCGRKLPAYICKYPDLITQSISYGRSTYTLKAAYNTSSTPITCENSSILNNEDILKSFKYVINGLESAYSSCGEMKAKIGETIPPDCSAEIEFNICRVSTVQDCTTMPPATSSSQKSRKLSARYSCEEFTTTVDGENLTFPSARPRRFSYSEEKCIDGRPKAVMFCQKWPSLNFTDLLQVPCEITLKESIRQILNQSEEAKLPLGLVMRQLHAVTLFDDMSEKNFSNISRILSKIAKRKNKTSNDVIANSVATVSELRRLLKEWKEKGANVSLSHDDLSALVQAIEKFAEHVAMSSNETSHKFSAEGVDMEVVELDDSVIYSGKNLHYENEDTDTSIRITPEIPLSRTLSTKKLRAIFTTYDGDDLFPTFEENVRVDSVISATVTDGEKTYSVPVEFSMRVMKDFNISSDKCVKKECRYYNHTEHKWRGDGCRKESESKEGYSDTVNCVCDHTTSFAVVVSEHAKPNYALDIISTIALSLCIVCLFLTIIVFFIVEELRRIRSAFTHKNLCICLAVAYLIFLAGVEATAYRYLCLAVAASMHFFLLASWGWMAVESMTMYRMFVRTMERRREPGNLKVAFFVYIISAAIVLLTMSFAALAQYQDWGDEIGCEDDFWASYISEGYCWLQGRSLYFGFLLIVGLALIFNVVLAGVIIKAITWGRKAVKCTREERPIIHVMRAMLVAMLLGVAWVFAVPLAVTDNRTVQEVFGYLFALTIFVQGAFIFYFFCIRRKDVRKSWTEAVMRVFRCRGKGEQESQPFGTSQNMVTNHSASHKFKGTPNASTASEITRKTTVVSRNDSALGLAVSPRKQDSAKSPTHNEELEMKNMDKSLDLVDFNGEEIFEG